MLIQAKNLSLDLPYPLLDFLLIKPVADADIHDRLNPADDAQWLEQLRMSVNRYIRPALSKALGLFARHRLDFLVISLPLDLALAITSKN